MIWSSPAFMVAMISETGWSVVIRSERPFEIGGMIATPSGMNGSNATFGWPRMYDWASGKVFGRAATTDGSLTTDTRDGVSSALPLAAATCVSLLVRYWINCHAAGLCVEAAFIQMPNGWTSAQWFGLAGGHGTSQKAVSSATVDLSGSSTSGMVPPSSCHMATRPCWKSWRQ